MGECWSGGTATFMLLGEVCTRGCRFCAVTGNPRGALDENEPEKVGYAISQMGLKYVVLTSVDRDDLPDEGSGHFARTVSVIKENCPELIVEVLTPDFRGSSSHIEKIVRAGPMFLPTIWKLWSDCSVPFEIHEQVMHSLSKCWSWLRS